jgi:hypothetical protein
MCGGNWWYLNYGESAAWVTGVWGGWGLCRPSWCIWRMRDSFRCSSLAIQSSSCSGCFAAFNFRQWGDVIIYVFRSICTLIITLYGCVIDWNLGNMIYNGLITHRLCGFPFVEIGVVSTPARASLTQRCAAVGRPAGPAPESLPCLQQQPRWPWARTYGHAKVEGGVITVLPLVH